MMMATSLTTLVSAAREKNNYTRLASSLIAIDKSTNMVIREAMLRPNEVGQSIYK